MDTTQIGIILTRAFVGWATVGIGVAVLKCSGKLVVYSAPVGLGTILGGLIKMIFLNATSGKTVVSYGISALYMRDKKPFMEDIAILFKMLEEGRIKPVITGRLPLLEARKACEMLESGQVAGNIVLLAPEMV